jgi:hypothetical protein
MYRLIIKHLITFVIFYLIGSQLELSFSYSSIKDFLTNMLVVSTMVFTLMGIWIAYLYPDALDKIKDQESKITNVDFTDTQARLKRLEFIVSSIFKSSITVIIIMAIFVFKIILEASSIYSLALPIIQSLTLPTIVILSLLQFEAIFNVLQANILFINELHGRKQSKEQEEDI